MEATRRALMDGWSLRNLPLRRAVKLPSPAGPPVVVSIGMTYIGSPYIAHTIFCSPSGSITLFGFASATTSGRPSRDALCGRRGVAQTTWRT
jgi:hypothetical protein